MRIEVVAKEWGISIRTVYRLVKNKLLPAEIVTDQKPQDRFDIASSLVSEVRQELDRGDYCYGTKKVGKKLSRPVLIRKYLAGLKEARESSRSKEKKEV